MPRNLLVNEAMSYAARRLAAVMGEFRRIEPNVPAQVIHFFLQAAGNPGKSITEIGKAIGLSKSSAQRAYQALSEESHWQEGRDPMGLLFTTPNTFDSRLMSVYLTAKGRRVLEAADNALAGGPDGSKKARARLAS